MKNEEKLMDLVDQIKRKSLINEAILRGIGAIIEIDSEMGAATKANNLDADIGYVPNLVSLSIGISKEIDEMSDEISSLMEKPEKN